MHCYDAGLVSEDPEEESRMDMLMEGLSDLMDAALPIISVEEEFEKVRERIKVLSCPLRKIPSTNLSVYCNGNMMPLDSPIVYYKSLEYRCMRCIPLTKKCKMTHETCYFHPTKKVFLV